MVIGIDIDDTLLDSKSEIIKAWEEYYNLYDLGNYTSNVPDNINTGWNDFYIRQFWNLYRTKIAERAVAKDYAKEALYKLKLNGHVIKVVTARPENQRLVSLKSLKSQLLTFDELILGARYKGETCKKHGIDLHIDDTQMNLDDIKSYGIDTLLFKENDNWKDKYNQILALARHKKRRF